MLIPWHFISTELSQTMVLLTCIYIYSTWFLDGKTSRFVSSYSFKMYFPPDFAGLFA